jgi:hypothetical protein
MRRVRIFISSPGDVSPEREAARRAIERLQREFPYHFRLEPILWEREPLKATEHFQAGLPPPRETDIAIVILWRRLGTVLPAGEYKGALSGEPVTGTEWEFEDAAAAAQRGQRPHLLVYRKTAPALATLDDDAALAEHQQQKRRVDAFFRRWFAGAEGSVRAAFHQFRDEVEFAEKVYLHLRGVLGQLMDPGADAGLPPTRRWTQGSPFRGLESFELAHAPIFFGRARAQLALRQALAGRSAAGTAFVLVFGASGSGKSSLVKAGLLADLATPGMFGRLALCRIALLRPGEAEGGDAVLALARAILGAGALPELARHHDAASLARFLALTASDPAQARALLGTALAEAGRAAALTEMAEARLVLVVDQLEELFAGSAFDAEARERFIAVLGALARSGACLVVATMRSDFFPALEEVPALAALSEGEGRFLLTPPSETELAQIIERPAEEAGVAFEQVAATGISLADRIRQAARKSRDALPLLEYLLDQLWQRRTPAGLLTHATYDQLNGLEGAIGARAEQVTAALAPETRAALPRLLRGLIQLDGAGTATARRLALSELPERGPERALADVLAAPNARLLVAGSLTPGDAGGPGGARPTLRLAHEALLTHWQAARRVIEEDRAFLLARGRAEQAAADWRREGEPDDRLLSPGSRALAEAQELLARRGELGADTARYIDRSLAAAAAAGRRQARSRRRVMAGMAALTLVAVAGAAYAVWQERKADATAELARKAAAAEAVARAAADAARRDAEAAAAKARAEESRAKANQARLALAAALTRVRAGDAVAALRLLDDTVRLLGTAAVTPEFEAIGHQALWTRREIRRVKLESVPFFVWWAADGRFFALGPAGIRAFDASLKPVGRFAIDDPAALATTPDWLPHVQRDGRYQVYDRDRSTVLWQEQLDERPTWDRIGEILVALVDRDACTLGLVHRLDGRVTMRSFSSSPEHFGKIRALCNDRFTEKEDERRVYAPDRKRYVSYADWGEAKLWDAEKNAAIRTLVAYNQGMGPRTGQFEFSPDGRFLAVAHDFVQTRIIQPELVDSRTGATLATLGGHTGRVKASLFSPDGQFLVTISEDGWLRLWSVAQNAYSRIPPPGREREPGFELARDERGRGVIRDRVSGAVLLDTGEPLAADAVPTLAKIVVAPDRRHVALVRGKTLDVWRIADGRKLLHVTEADPAQDNLLFSPDGTLLAMGSEGRFGLWRLSDGRALADRRLADWIMRIWFVPSADRLGLELRRGEAYETATVDLSTGAVTTLLAGYRRNGLPLARGATLLAARGRDVVEMSLFRGTTAVLASFDRPVAALAVDKAEKMMAVLTADQRVHLLDLAEKRPPARVEIEKSERYPLLTDPLLSLQDSGRREWFVCVERGCFVLDQESGRVKLRVDACAEVQRLEQRDIYVCARSDGGSPRYYYLKDGRAVAVELADEAARESLAGSQSGAEIRELPRCARAIVKHSGGNADTPYHGATDYWDLDGHRSLLRLGSDDFRFLGERNPPGLIGNYDVAGEDRPLAAASADGFRETVMPIFCEPAKLIEEIRRVLAEVKRP